MAGTTSVPDIAFTPAGLVVPEESAIRAGAYADMNAAFGGNLNPDASTPQGQLITSQTAIIGDKNNQFLAFVNGIDPATSSGFMQDAIGRIYGLTRLPALPTTVDVLCSGKTGVVIPIGSTVLDVSGNIYASTAAGTIPVGGSITIPFAAVVTGPTPCPIGAINRINKTVFGWDSATNAVAGVTGVNVESRADFEFRRKLSVAGNANGSVQAVYGSVINVAGVTDLYVTDNRTNTPVVIDGQTLTPHSIYVAAVGGTDLAVATAVWKKTSAGCDFNGNTTVVVTDDSGYNLPAPTYQIKFERPPDFNVYFAVTVQNLSGLPNATVETAIKNSIISAFSGSDGGTRARIGSTLLATRYIQPVAAAAQVAILSIFIGSAPAPVGVSQYVQIDQAPITSAANIDVTFV